MLASTRSKLQNYESASADRPRMYTGKHLGHVLLEAKFPISMRGNAISGKKFK